MKCKIQIFTIRNDSFPEESFVINVIQLLNQTFVLEKTPIL
jgi:hypothetical protein